LILVVYGLGVGMATTGTPLVTGSGVATTPADVRAAGFLSRLAAGALALVPVAVTVHYANEYADVETDALTTRTPFSGGSGALVLTDCEPAVLRRATGLSFALAVVAIAAAGLTATLALDAVAYLLTILGAGLAYSLPPTALIRRGVGELVNALLGGLVLPLYGVAVVGTPTVRAHLAVGPFVLVVGCSLLATHWPDRTADATVGKRTLVVRWGPRRIRRLYALLAGIAAAWTLWLWHGETIPRPVALAHLLAGPLLVRGHTVLTRQRSPLPSVLAMVVLAVASLSAWWWAGVGP
jgi:1,4-dihydroxy-2-naphthoate octaprenyltransferase